MTRMDRLVVLKFVLLFATIGAQAVILWHYIHRASEIEYAATQPDPPSALAPLDDSTKRIFVCTMPDGRLERTEVYGLLGVNLRGVNRGARECHEVGDDPRGSY